MHFVRLPRRHSAVRLAAVIALALTLSLPVIAAEMPSTLAPAAVRDALQAAWQRHPT